MNKFSKKEFSKKKRSSIVLPLSYLILTACGGGGGSGQQENFSGFVIKGPLSKATVFADYDGDGI